MKLIINIIAIAIMSLAFTISVQGQTVDIELVVGRPSISINGESLPCVEPYIYNDSTLVPLRIIGEALNLTVAWNPSERSVTLEDDRNIIVLTIDNHTAVVNGNALPLLAAPQLNNGRTMVPVRFISEQIGATVNFTPIENIIDIYRQIPPPVLRKNNPYQIMAAANTPRVGDSYYGWSIDTPTPLRLTDVDFTGGNLSFEAYTDEVFMQICSTQTTDIQSQQAQDVGMDVLSDVFPSENQYGNTVYEKTIYSPDGVPLSAIVAGVTKNSVVSVSIGFGVDISGEKREQYLDILRSFDTVFTSNSADMTQMTDGGVFYVNYDANYTAVIPTELYEVFSDEEDFHPKKVMFKPVESEEDDRNIIALEVYVNTQDYTKVSEFVTDKINFYNFTYNKERIYSIKQALTTINSIEAAEISFIVDEYGVAIHHKEILFLLEDYCYVIKGEFETNEQTTEILTQIAQSFSPYEIYSPALASTTAVESVQTYEYYDNYFNFTIKVPVCAEIIEGSNGITITLESAIGDTTIFEIACDEIFPDLTPEQELEYARDSFVQLYNDYAATDYMEEWQDIDGNTIVFQSFKYLYESEYTIHQFCFTLEDMVYTIRLTAEDLYNTNQKLELTQQLVRMILVED